MRSYIIRFRRVGGWQKPVYHVVVSFKTSPISGRYVEKLGFYAPTSLNKFFFINLERCSFWLMRGAGISERCGFILGKFFPI